MLEDLLGNSGKMQEELAAKLKEIEVVKDLDGIVIKANGAKEILSLSIADNLMSIENKEQLEDQLIVLLNRTLDEIAAIEQKQSADFMKQMLPPGFENLFS
jgi:nucleoid-associated protein EbfC